jgi:uncharacterized protein YdcH (DUF465 family)
MKRLSEDMSPHFRELIAKFREAQARSQELARESEAFAQRIREMLSEQKAGNGRPQEQGNG